MRESVKKCMLSVMLPGLAILLTVGCDRFFGHDDQITDPLTVRDRGLSCVRSVGSDFTEFFAGANDRDPVATVDCISAALTRFSNTTRGANGDGWTRGELSSFFEKYFAEESNDEGAVDGKWKAQAGRRTVVTEVFRWKAALLGGGETTLSRGELIRIQLLLEKLRMPLSTWRGQGKLLSLADSASVADIEKLTKSIRQVAELITAEIDTKSGALSRKSIRNPMPLQELSASLDMVGFKFIESQERQALMRVLKRVILSGDPNQIVGDEWGELVQQASEFWIAALRIKNGILPKTQPLVRDVDFVEKATADILKSVARMIARHGGRIDADEIRQLITLLEENRLLPSYVRAKSVNAALEPILGKLLGGNALSNQVDLMKGLSQPQLDRLFDVVHDWSEGQRLSLSVMGSASFSSIEQARQSMSVLATTATDKVGDGTRQQMSELILRGRPLIYDAVGRLEISNLRLDGYQRSDLEKLNFARVLMSAAMRGYSKETARAGVMPHMTESEIQELFADLKAILRDLGIADVRSLQSGIRTFMEANIFLSVSDGNQYISLHEMVEWFQTVLSAGLVADQVHADMIQDFKCGTAPMDVFGKQRLISECFRKHSEVVLMNRLSHLPHFVRALSKAKSQGRLPIFLKSFEQASRALGDSDLPIESSELRAMAPIIHYVEALFTRFDKNDSSVLEAAEVWDVFPLIRPFIQKVAVDVDGNPIKMSVGIERAIFSWMLENGAPPPATTATKISLWINSWSMTSKTEKAGFEDIVKILGSFQMVGREKKNKDMLKYYELSSQRWESGIGSGNRQILVKTRDLLQCSDEADTDLLRLLQARRADIFAIDSSLEQQEQGRAFVVRLKSMVQADPQLQLLCMAF